MRDLYTYTIKIGSKWLGVYKLPWKTEPHLVHENGTAKRFDTQAEASQAASDALCGVFADHTTGYAAPLNKAKSEAEALFKR